MVDPSIEQTGPPIDLSRLALGFELVPEKHGQRQKMGFVQLQSNTNLETFPLIRRLQALLGFCKGFMDPYPSSQKLAEDKKSPGRPF